MQSGIKRTKKKIGRFSIVENRGALYLRWWNPHLKKTKSERLDAKTLAEAETLAKARIRVLVDPSETIRPESGDDPTFGEIWLALEQRKREKMEAGDLHPKRFYLLELRREKYFRPFLWSVPTSRLESAMKDLDKALRKGSVDHGIDKPRSPNTIDDIIKTARQVWRLAFEQGRTKHGPASDYATPGYTPPLQRKPKGRYCGVEEIGRLISIAHHTHVRDLLIIEQGTGVRTGAIADLKANQVYFDLGVINFHPLEQIRGNKNKPISAITGPMWAVLQRLVDNAHPDGWLFHYHGKPIATGNRNFYQTIARLAERAGIDLRNDDGSLNWYSLRRTFTDTLDEYVSGADISLALGHVVINKSEQRKILEQGSPMSDIYKSRKLGPVYRVGEVIEREWWPRLQPHCEVYLGSKGPRMTAKGPVSLMQADADVA